MPLEGSSRETAEVWQMSKIKGRPMVAPTKTYKITVSSRIEVVNISWEQACLTDICKTKHFHNDTFKTDT